MTESITTPFVLTTREACEKAAAVILGPPSPRVKGTANFKYVTGEELDYYTEKLRQRHLREKEAVTSSSLNVRKNAQGSFPLTKISTATQQSAIVCHRKTKC